MPFSAREIIAALILGGFAIMANMLALVIVGQINEKVPANERLSYFGWDSRIRKLHKHLYPKSKLVLFFDLCGILMVACIPIVLWSMGFFNRR
jgi:hypothetical protein